MTQTKIELSKKYIVNYNIYYLYFIKLSSKIYI